MGALHPVQIHRLSVPATQVSGVTPAPSNVAGQALGYPPAPAPAPPPLTHKYFVLKTGPEKFRGSYRRLLGHSAWWLRAWGRPSVTVPQPSPCCMPAMPSGPELGQ